MKSKLFPAINSIQALSWCDIAATAIRACSLSTHDAGRASWLAIVSTIDYNHSPSVVELDGLGSSLFRQATHVAGVEMICFKGFFYIHVSLHMATRPVAVLKPWKHARSKQAADRKSPPLA